jgi:ATP adenylyltransferase
MTLKTFQRCAGCATPTRAGGDSDLRVIKESYATRETGCPFCDLGERKVVAENPLAFLIEDAFPVTNGHLLAIPRRHVGDFFELRQPERNALHRLLEEGRALLLKAEPAVEGFNVGVNAGAAAGQTVFHCRLHLIPRRAGDVENPRGGVRGVVPGRQDYGPR